MDNEIESYKHEYTNEIVCPYCLHQHSDSWEIRNDYGEMNCEECNKSFSYERNVEISYSTNKL